MSSNVASATAYSFPSHSQSQPSQPNPESTSSEETKPSDAASALAGAIDDFLGDLERKFKNVSDEILTKLDEMAERCDRLEAELLLRDAAGAGTSKSSLEEKSEG